MCNVILCNMIRVQCFVPDHYCTAVWDNELGSEAKYNSEQQIVIFHCHLLDIVHISAHGLLHWTSSRPAGFQGFLYLNFLQRLFFIQVYGLSRVIDRVSWKFFSISIMLHNIVLNWANVVFLNLIVTDNAVVAFKASNWFNTNLNKTNYIVHSTYCTFYLVEQHHATKPWFPNEQ